MGQIMLQIIRFTVFENMTRKVLLLWQFFPILTWVLNSRADAIKHLEPITSFILCMLLPRRA